MNTEQKNRFPQNQEPQFQELISDEEQESSSQISSEDEVKQKAVFQIIDEQQLITFQHKQKSKIQEADHQDEQNDGINEDQRQAFLYLLSVRKQKKTLLQQKKRRKAESKKTVINVIKENFQTQINNQGISIKKQKQQITQKENSLINKNEYSDCILKNFHIVIENAKYLIKNDPAYSHNNKKFNVKLYESIKLQNEPLIYELIKLTIGQIQDAIRKLSLQLNLGPKNKKQQNKQSQKDIELNVKQEKTFLMKYCLWIYSLLALHQAWSSYKHFQSLAQINYVLTLQVSQIQNLSHEQKKSILLLLILMINVFEQKHLQKYLEQMLKSINQFNKSENLDFNSY